MLWLKVFSPINFNRTRRLRNVYICNESHKCTTVMQGVGSTVQEIVAPQLHWLYATVNTSNNKLTSRYKNSNQI